VNEPAGRQPLEQIIPVGRAERGDIETADVIAIDDPHARTAECRPSGAQRGEHDRVKQHEIAIVNATPRTTRPIGERHWCATAISAIGSVNQRKTSIRSNLGWTTGSANTRCTSGRARRPGLDLGDRRERDDPRGLALGSGDRRLDRERLDALVPDDDRALVGHRDRGGVVEMGRERLAVRRRGGDETDQRGEYCPDPASCEAPDDGGRADDDAQHGASDPRDRMAAGLDTGASP
jgi:hypothetical protein